MNFVFGEKMDHNGLRLCNVDSIDSPFFGGMYEFHIAKEIRRKYDIDDVFFSSTGNVIFANFTAVRKFVQSINNFRDDENKLKTGEVNAIGLLDEIYHYVLTLYEETVNPGVFKKAISYLTDEVGEDSLNRLFFDFLENFPPNSIFHRKVSSFDYLNGLTGNKQNTEIVIQEIMLLYFDNLNPAGKKLKELFNHEYLKEEKLYLKIIDKLNQFFKNEEKFGIGKQDIFDLLSTPINFSPDDVELQLEFIRKNWGILLSKDLMKRILSSWDLLKEDKMSSPGGGGPGPSIVPSYTGAANDKLTLGKSGVDYAWDSWKDYEEPEAFTPDFDWMPNVVMIAKNTYVWLDQLSKQYQREIKTLDQIPDEEIERLAGYNFNALWLIGIWERSRASKRIKHLMGNIDAVASAYSLYDYQIASDLGGEWAYDNFNQRCRAKGIRLASDMVPNHTGIFSKWVIQHPEFFIQTDQPPFPGYTFTGENLSEDPNVQIRIEDKYFSKSDASVVFQRIDNNSGEIRYIYHGNDGTNMPWNDTAQLDMLKHEVREAVIGEIFNVARKFSIIRFDAAMTLAKKHFSRLWYPEPGKGGDIPSRSDYALTRAEFEEFFPNEFWREVVDRINNELPQTLLLAEAFWLMEGYFVRTLGMHRVYNSAFMNMLKNEENKKYRELITNTLEFEPEILKRYVNFMSNPDEETAIKQFGTDDKYFGVAVLMITLPGLPMFAHGQVEGFSEKYGMEYQRAYYHEQPLGWLVDRHKKVIFPLMKYRFLFSEIRNFWFYDFIDDNGHLNQNVFAYSNFEFGQRAVVFYNNKYEETSGTIHTSTPKLDENKNLIRKSLAEALQIKNSDEYYYIYKEHISGLEFLKKGSDIHKYGIHEYLGAFKFKVFIDFREIHDVNNEYFELSKMINGQGVWNVEAELKEMKYEPVIRSLANLLSESEFEDAVSIVVEKQRNKIDKVVQPLIERYNEYLTVLAEHFKANKQYKRFTDKIVEFPAKIKNTTQTIDKLVTKSRTVSLSEISKLWLFNESNNYRENALLYQIYLIIDATSALIEKQAKPENIVHFLHLERTIVEVLCKHGRGEYSVRQLISLLNVLRTKSNKVFRLTEAEYRRIAEKNNFKVTDFLREKKADFIDELLNDKYVRDFLGVNFYNGVWYFSKENFEELVFWLFSLELIEVANPKKSKTAKTRSSAKNSTIDQKIKILNQIALTLIEAAKFSEYRLFEMLNWISD